MRNQYLLKINPIFDKTNLLLDELNHTSTDCANLGALGVASFLDLVGALAGESNAENAEEVSVGGLYGSISLNQRLQ